MDVITAGDGSSVGSVRVPTVDDARLAISQLHRHKVGYKRLDRWKVVALLVNGRLIIQF